MRTCVRWSDLCVIGWWLHFLEWGVCLQLEHALSLHKITQGVLPFFIFYLPNHHLSTTWWKPWVLRARWAFEHLLGALHWFQLKKLCYTDSLLSTRFCQEICAQKACRLNREGQTKNEWWNLRSLNIDEMDCRPFTSSFSPVIPNSLNAVFCMSLHELPGWRSRYLNQCL